MMRKRALLVGLNYTFDPAARLAGCCNDVRAMSKFLQGSCGFKPNQIDIIIDENIRELYKATKEGLMEAIYGLCIASWKEDLEFVMFHYSGHGSQMKDMNGDEADGQDEGIVPVDYRKCGLILDDSLFSIFTRFNPKTKILCFFDCCHSGTIMDLPFAYDINKLVQVAKTDSPNLPVIYCISGCRDDQVSMDSFDPIAKIPAGAMTNCLLKLLSDKPDGYPLLQLQEDLNKLLKQRGYDQRPLLTSSVSLLPDDKLF